MRDTRNAASAGRDKRIAAALITALAAMTNGCASPPSVAPLLGVAESAIAEERRHLTDDDARRAAWIGHQRSALAAAFTLDLAERGEAIDPAWVGEGVSAYVAAREALLRHEITLAQQSELRRENLDRAAAVLRRAAAILQQQDRLFDAMPDLRRSMPTLVNETNTPLNGDAR